MKKKTPWTLKVTKWRSGIIKFGILSQVVTSGGFEFKSCMTMLRACLCVTLAVGCDLKLQNLILTTLL